MAIRMLPYQGQFLIVRKIGYRPDQTNEGHVIEIYPVLYCSHERIEQEVHAQDRRHMPGFNLLSVHITDHGIPFNVDDSIVPRLRKNNFLQKLDDKEIPFPVTILCRTDSIVHQYYRITIFPVPVRDDYISSSRGRTMLTPVYDLSNHNVSAWRQPDEDTELHYPISSSSPILDEDSHYDDLQPATNYSEYEYDNYVYDIEPTLDEAAILKAAGSLTEYSILGQPVGQDTYSDESGNERDSDASSLSSGMRIRLIKNCC